MGDAAAATAPARRPQPAVSEAPASEPLAQPLPLAQPPLACLAPRSRRRWIDATAGEDAVLEEMLQRWAAPLHEGGCGNSGRLR